MWKQASLFALVTALAACSGGDRPNPVNGQDPDEPTTPVEPVPDIVIPAAILSDLESLRLDVGDPNDPSDDTLIVTGLNLDTGEVDGVYERAPEADVPGYRAFSTQDDRLDRIFVALYAEAAEGAVYAGAVGDGGQFDKFFRGIYYDREGDFTPPTESGLVSYGGRYAAVTNFGTNDPTLVEEGPRPNDPPAVPRQPLLLTGEVFFNVDFADNSMNGVVYNRRFEDGTPTGDTLFLDPTEISETGTFEGDVLQETQESLDNQEPPRGVGTYAGVFGGENAEGMAGGLTAASHLPSVEPDDRAIESGIFVIPRCGAAGSPTFCDGLGDFDGPIGE
ncbi:MAG: hypothetical protein AAGB05_06685 [Pseudomonadota bacterium]